MDWWRKRRAARGVARLHLWILDDGPAPLALCLAGPLVRGVDPHLAAQPGFGRSEIEIIDGRVLGDQRVARRIHARGERPDHFLPVADVDVLIHHYDELGVHELAQEAPDAEHHALGVPRIGLFDRHQRHAVGAALRRQVEIDDLRILALQQRHEDFVQGHAQHRRLVRRLAGVSGVVDRIAPQRDALEREHGEDRLLVVIARVIPEWTFESRVAGMDVPFEHDLGARRHLQAPHGLGELGFGAAQQAGELVLGKGIGRRRDRGEDGGRIAADHHRHGKRFVGVQPGVFGVIDRPAAMGEPAHDHPV
jgi:hypothetical protein